MNQKLKRYLISKDISESELESVAEYVVPSLIFNLSEDIAKLSVLNEDLAQKAHAPTGIDNIIIDEKDSRPKFIQVKTGSNSAALESVKLKKDALEVYHFFEKENALKISQAYGIDESVALKIKERIVAVGYDVIFISAFTMTKDISDDEILIYKESDIEKALAFKSIPWKSNNKFQIILTISNKKDTAIIYENGSAIDVHVDILDLLHSFKKIVGNQMEIAFEDNVRAESKGASRRIKSVQEGIINTLKNTPDEFINNNNGITILTERLIIQNLPNNVEKRRIIMDNPNIINGQQTFKTALKNIDDLKPGARVMMRIKQVNDKIVWHNIAAATNSMIKVSDLDLVASQPKIKEKIEALYGYKIFIITKYKLPTHYSDFLSIDFDDILAIVFMLKYKVFDYSNKRTQILDDLSAYPEAINFIDIKNHKILKNIINLFNAFNVPLSDVTRNQRRIIVSSILENQNDGEGKIFKNIKIMKSKIQDSNIIEKIKKLNSDFRAKEKKETTNHEHNKEYVKNIIKILK